MFKCGRRVSRLSLSRRAPTWLLREMPSASHCAYIKFVLAALPCFDLNTAAMLASRCTCAGPSCQQPLRKDGRITGLWLCCARSRGHAVCCRQGHLPGDCGPCDSADRRIQCPVRAHAPPVPRRVHSPAAWRTALTPLSSHLCGRRVVGGRLIHALGLSLPLPLPLP